MDASTQALPREHWQVPLVWVYGTLRQGERNHWLLKERAEYRGRHTCNGQLYAIEDPVEALYPAVILQSQADPVVGELFYLPEAVRAQVYRDLDILEEIGINLYQVVSLPTLDAVAYVAGPSLWQYLQTTPELKVRQIPGDWSQYRQQGCSH
ncbi:gamma-glutamylcyclotransferase [Leptolyngbya sp. FACHB-261]|uniref:gamma-glutamylcyclotransferase family protein n=1 Tax=Leptolyngbya sp. FACHB-261 TaxID=2692806 RepID=UPI0016896959|nr:gamma-glutamylcyclotransferase family protein [Leptolyngbya sp. FACHB-261]